MYVHDMGVGVSNCLDTVEYEYGYVFKHYKHVLHTAFHLFMSDKETTSNCLRKIRTHSLVYKNISGL